MGFCRGNVEKRGDVAAQVHLRVNLDGVLLGLVERPREEAHAQVDDRRVQRVDLLGESNAQVVIAIKPPRLFDERLREIGEDAPVA